MTMTFYRITNRITSLDYCPNNDSWVNDGRESTMFQSREVAEQYLKTASDGWDDGVVSIEEMTFNDEE